MKNFPDSKGDVADFRARLLAFFDARRRDLPWRRDTDPYRVWVSEIMLQQTRVETVIPYFERWTRRFPDVRRLAEAPEAEVLRHWEGLGYYSRARNLHGAAKVVREEMGGRIPDDPAELRRLPGVGEYTAGAIASIAFGVPVPAVDGNVRRVLARLADESSPRASDLRDAAAALVDPARPGDFNQALMELGSLVCTPRSPACARCPVAGHCAARAAGTQEQRPAPRKTAPVPERDVATAVILAPDGRLLLRRRPATGLLARMWELPGEELREAGVASEEAAAAAAALARRLTAGEPLHPEGPAAAVSHTFSHLRLHYRPWRFRLTAAPPPPESGHAWVAEDELGDFALPRAQRKLLALLS